VARSILLYVYILLPPDWSFSLNMEVKLNFQSFNPCWLRIERMRLLSAPYCLASLFSAPTDSQGSPNRSCGPPTGMAADLSSQSLQKCGT
jgi:hypothetical protein